MWERTNTDPAIGPWLEYAKANGIDPGSVTGRADFWMGFHTRDDEVRELTEARDALESKIEKIRALPRYEEWGTGMEWADIAAILDADPDAEQTIRELRERMSSVVPEPDSWGGAL